MDASLADTIAHRLTRSIEEKWDEDPIFFEKFSKLISDTIFDFHNGERGKIEERIERKRPWIFRQIDLTDLQSSVLEESEKELNELVRLSRARAAADFDCRHEARELLLPLGA